LLAVKTAFDSLPSEPAEADAALLPKQAEHSVCRPDHASDRSIEWRLPADPEFEFLYARFRRRTDV
jgi:hypothetical protein